MKAKAKQITIKIATELGQCEVNRHGCTVVEALGALKTAELWLEMQMIRTLQAQDKAQDEAAAATRSKK